MRPALWFAVAVIASGCGANAASDGLAPPGPSMTVAERNASAPAPGARAAGRAFWCSPQGGGGQGAACFASAEECAAFRRGRQREGLATPPCARRTDDAWCRERCDDEGRCSSRCYASAGQCATDGSGCMRSPPPTEPFQPLGRQWWCYAASALGVCYRQESSCRYFARQKGQDDPAVTDCSVQPRAACVVMEDAMRDEYTVSCFASTSDCAFAAERTSRDPDHRVVRSCVVWE